MMKPFTLNMSSCGFSLTSVQVGLEFYVRTRAYEKRERWKAALTS